jgi:3-oxoisoapionate decarboxylase
MKLGISSYAYPWSVGASGTHKPAQPLRPSELIDRAQKLDVHVLQLADGLLGLGDMSDAQLDALRSKAALRGIALETGTRSVDAAEIERFLAIANRMGSPLLRVVMRTAQVTLTMDQTAALCRALLPACERLSVVLAIETGEARSVKELRAMLDAINSRFLGVVFDTANSLGRLETAEQVLDGLEPHIVNFHVKDVQIKRLPSSFGFVIDGTPAGDGIIDIPTLLKRVGAIRTAKAVPEINAILEHWGAFTNTIEETMTLEDQWVEKSVRYLRQFVAA